MSAEVVGAHSLTLDGFAGGSGKPPFRWGYLAVGVIIAALLAVVVWGAVGKWNTDKEMTRLRNEAASNAQTIEVQKGVFTKLTLESNDLRKLLDTKDEQIKGLVSQVKKSNEDLLAANQLVVTWKKAYQGALAASQTHIDPVTPGQPGRDKVAFHKDWGAITVKGWTLTNPPEAWLEVAQGRPLKLTVAVTQDDKRQWHTYATSSDDNMNIDIALTAVNPYILEPKWYEKLSLGVTIAGGAGPDCVGFLGGIGVNYKIGKFNVGPAVFVSFLLSPIMPPIITAFYGAQVAWRPFER